MVPGILIVGASYAGDDLTMVLILFSLAMGFMGLWYPGMKVNPIDLSPNYAATIMAISNGIGALTGAVTPYVVGVLTPQVSRNIFYSPFPTHQIHSQITVCN